MFVNNVVHDTVTAELGHVVVGLCVAAIDCLRLSNMRHFAAAELEANINDRRSTASFFGRSDTRQSSDNTVFTAHVRGIQVFNPSAEKGCCKQDQK
jgi:hypothetical protein